MKNRQLLAAALFVLAAAVTPGPLKGQPAATPPAVAPILPLTADQWREDLSFMGAEMAGPSRCVHLTS